MTDDTDETITVEALDRSREFESREELAEFVRSFLGNRIYGPMEQACICRLNELSNGDSPPAVKRVARRVGFHGPERDPAAERKASPFGERIEKLEEELAERQEDHEAAREELFTLRDELTAKDRRGEPVSRAERDRLRNLKEDQKDARRRVVRAKAALGKVKRAADRWRADQRARYQITEGGETRVVTKEELHRHLDAQR